MNFTMGELEFLSAWAREEWTPACYQLPAHRLQMAHGVRGADLVSLIKAWTASAGTKDRDILDAAANSQPCWPWSTIDEFHGRLTEACRVSGVAAKG
jgi:hypothetical protein